MVGGQENSVWLADLKIIGLKSLNNYDSILFIVGIKRESNE